MIYFFLISFVTGQNIFDYADNFNDSFTHGDNNLAQQENGVVHDDDISTVVAYTSISLEENVKLIKAQLSGLEDTQQSLAQARLGSGKKHLLVIVNVNTELSVYDYAMVDNGTLPLDENSNFDSSYFNVYEAGDADLYVAYMQKMLSNEPWLLSYFTLEFEVNYHPLCPSYWRLNNVGVCVPTQYYYEVNCETEAGEVFIDDRLLNAYGLTWQVRLNDGTCSSNPTETGAVITKHKDITGQTTGNKYAFPYDSCNTEITEDDIYVKFNNFIVMSVEKVDGIQARANLQIPIVCKMEKNVVLSSEVQVGPHDIALEKVTEHEGDVNFSFGMELYDTANFVKERDTKQFVIMDHIFFQISAPEMLPTFGPSGVNMKYVINRCGLKQGETQFDFVSSGCMYTPLKTTRYTKWLTPVNDPQQFSFRGFLFPTMDTSGLQLECEVSICIDECPVLPTQDICDNLANANYLA